MNWLFASGHAADLVLAVLAAEALWLARRMSLADALAALLPAAMMMVALRGALTGAGWLWIALPLAAAFPLHLVDLARRGAIHSRRA